MTENKNIVAKNTNRALGIANAKQGERKVYKIVEINDVCKKAESSEFFLN